MRGWWPLALSVMVACDDASSDDNGQGDTDVGSEVEDGPFASILRLTGDAEAGGTEYANNCAACHASDGTGGAGTNLTVSVPEMTDVEIVEVIVQGQGSMPGFGSILGDQGVADVLAYLTDAFGG